MNYFSFESLFHIKYIYADLSSEYQADSLLCRHKIPVKFKGEYIRDDEKYRLVVCKIRKKYKESFLEAMEELKTKMCLLGHNDYEDWCRRLMEEIPKGGKSENKKG